MQILEYSLRIVPNKVRVFLTPVEFEKLKSLYSITYLTITATETGYVLSGSYSNMEGLLSFMKAEKYSKEFQNAEKKAKQQLLVDIFNEVTITNEDD